MIERHTFEDDGNGYCAVCPMPERNLRFHLAAAPNPLPPVHRAAVSVALEAPVTSLAAAAKAAPRAGTLRAQILALVADAPRGLTDDEIERRTGRKHQSVSSTTHHLRKDGYLEPLAVDGESVTRTTSSGSEAAAWTLTAAAREHLRAGAA